MPPRQLPEPLVLHGNYDELIATALRFQDNPADLASYLEILAEIMLNLPKANRYTLRYIIEHLHRVAQNQVTFYNKQYLICIFHKS